jgi:hypothetical protein
MYLLSSTGSLLRLTPLQLQNEQFQIQEGGLRSAFILDTRDANRQA